MKRERYHLSNGYHNTETYVLVEPRIGAIVNGRTMRRAYRALCGMSDCQCGSSPASDPREGQREGFARYPEYTLQTRCGTIGNYDCDDMIVAKSE